MNRTILLAEDEDDVRDLLGDYLGSRGHAVLPAANGASALALSRSFGGSIDLLLTDVIMPAMTGLDLAHHVQRERPGIEVVFMSGYAPRLAELRASGCPSAAFLAKPFSLRALDAAVQGLLARA